MGKTVFIDLFLLLLLQILVLFLMAIIIIGDNEADPQPELPVYIMVEYTWNAEDNSDVDGWARRNSDDRTICFFKSRENDVFILHNDNTGISYGTVDGRPLKYAREKIEINTEIIEGEDNFFEISLHGYRVPDRLDYTSVNVSIFQANPYQPIFEGDIKVFHGEESKVCSFTVNKDGNIETEVRQDHLFYIIDSSPSIPMR
jgi:hypothetical protein